ncbi:MAG: tetratricopeptide repeat protein [Chloroflexi bacterium]|nr:tetratricopeptide repeat protein [Chloroflexota bacterium]
MGLLGFIFKGGKNLPEADQELANKLEEIGMIKNQLPFKYRGLCNELGFFVQLREIRGMTSLKAGGKYRSKIHLWKESPTDSWWMKMFVPGEWENLVEPSLTRAKQVLFTTELTRELLNSLGGVLDAPEPDQALHQRHKLKIENWMAANGEDEELLTMLGLLCLRLEDYQAAEAAYKKALILNPQSEESLTRLGIVYFRLEDYQAGEAAYKKAITLNPQSEESHIALGVLYMAAIADVTGAGAISGEIFRVITKGLDIGPQMRQEFPELFEDDDSWVPTPSAESFGQKPKELMRLAREHFKEVIRITKREDIKHAALEHLKTLALVEYAHNEKFQD